MTTCSVCNGLRLSLGPEGGECRSCRGTGHALAPCLSCKGLDWRARMACSDCSGFGNLDPATHGHVISRQHEAAARNAAAKVGGIRFACGDCGGLGRHPHHVPHRPCRTCRATGHLQVACAACGAQGVGCSRCVGRGFLCTLRDRATIERLQPATMPRPPAAPRPASPELEAAVARTARVASVRTPVPPARPPLRMPTTVAVRPARRPIAEPAFVESRVERDEVLEESARAAFDAAEGPQRGVRRGRAA